MCGFKRKYIFKFPARLLWTVIPTFPPDVLFLGKDWRIQQRISTWARHTAHQIIPFIPIKKAHPTRRYTSEEHIGEVNLVYMFRKGLQILFKKQIRQDNKKIVGKNVFGTNIMKRAAQQSQINSPAHVKWFNVTLWCDTHIWTWKLWEGTSYIHRRTTGRVWPFLIQRQFFHFDSLLSFNLAKQFPLTWWDRVDGGTEARAAQELLNIYAERSESSGCYTCEGNRPRRLDVSWVCGYSTDAGSTHEQALSSFCGRTPDFCAIPWFSLHLWPVRAVMCHGWHVGRSHPSRLSCKSKHLLP